MRVIGVGSQGTAEQAAEFVRATGVQGLPMYWDDGYDAWAVFNVTATPAALLVDPNGAPLAGWVGPVPMDEILKYL